MHVTLIEYLEYGVWTILMHTLKNADRFNRIKFYIFIPLAM